MNTQSFQKAPQKQMEKVDTFIIWLLAVWPFVKSNRLPSAGLADEEGHEGVWFTLSFLYPFAFPHHKCLLREILQMAPQQLLSSMFVCLAFFPPWCRYRTYWELSEAATATSSSVKLLWELLHRHRHRHASSTEQQPCPDACFRASTSQFARSRRFLQKAQNSGCEWYPNRWGRERKMIQLFPLETIDRMNWCNESIQRNENPVTAALCVWQWTTFR